MATFKKPLPVYHIGRMKLEDEAAAVLHAAKVCHLSKGATALLQFYTKRSSGFAPAAEFISKETGISRRQIFDARIMLENKTLIIVTEKPHYTYSSVKENQREKKKAAEDWHYDTSIDEFHGITSKTKKPGIYVNWKAIYTLQIADPRFTTKRDFCRIPHESNYEKTVKEFLYGDLNKSIGLLETLTEEEYGAFVTAVRREHEKWEKLLRKAVFVRMGEVTENSDWNRQTPKKQADVPPISEKDVCKSIEDLEENETSLWIPVPKEHEMVKKENFDEGCIIVRGKNGERVIIEVDLDTPS